MADNILPDSFESWEHCITIKCGIKLTSGYVEQRIKELNDIGEESTKRFISLYGQEHHRNVLNWFEHRKAGAF